MATETDHVNHGAYVRGVSRGHTRWFFSVSVPHDYLDWLGSGDALLIASVVDKLLLAARRSGSPADF